MSFGEQPIVRFSKEKNRSDPSCQRKDEYDPRCGLCLGVGKIRSSLHHSGFITCESCNGTGWSKTRSSK
jgi:hypothetical protein